MPQTEQRKGGPVSFAQALGADKASDDLVLNTFEQATCHQCGAEPRLHTMVTPKGRTVVIWIPVDHSCTRTKGLS